MTTESVKIGDRVSYEDMANPRRVGEVRAFLDSEWGRSFVVVWDDGLDTASDLRQAGWRPVCNERTLGPDDVIAPCVLSAGHGGFHSTGR